MDEGTREGAILICIRKQEGLTVRGGGRIFFRLEPALSVSALSQWTPLIEAPTHKDPWTMQWLNTLLLALSVCGSVSGLARRGRKDFLYLRRRWRITYLGN